LSHRTLRHKSALVVAFPILFVLPLIAWSGPKTDEPKPVPREQAARAFVEHLDKGEFAEATQNFDAAMLKALPPDNLKKGWERLVGDVGAFQNVIGTRVESKDNIHRVLVTCAFANSKIDFVVAFDKDAKIAGLSITPTEMSRPQNPKKPYPYDEIEVSYENKLHGIKLTGALTVPRSKGPFPAVILITGSGPQDRDETILGHKPFLVLADYLTRRGIAVLRVDDRGVGGSTGSLWGSTSADFAEDVLAGVAFLKGRKEINPAQIGLIGHSEGGMIAPMVASRSKDIAFIVSLAGPGVPCDEILYTQSAAGLKLAKARPEALTLLRTLQDRLFATIRAEKDHAQSEKKFRAAVEEITSKLSNDEKKQAALAQDVVEEQASILQTTWGRYFLDYDPRPALRKVTCPVLALNGAKDVQVDVSVNLRAIEAALKEAGNKDVTIRELPGLNHMFQTCQTGAVSEYFAIEETLAPVVLETLADWITKRTNPGR
jgi:pimeloyl-ACP methyl ester carboxylesterase